MKRLTARNFRMVPGTNYGTPKELWHFESDRGRGRPEETALEFLRLHAGVLGIERELDSLRVRRKIESLGASHVILEQKLRRRRIYRAYVTVHVRHDGRVYLVKNRAVPSDVLALAPEARLGAARAVSVARRAISHSKGRLRIIGEPEALWFPLRRLIHPAWRVRVHRTRPRSEWIVYVSAETGRVLQTQDNLASATGRATVFLPNPMSGDHAFRPIVEGKLKEPTPGAYQNVRLPRLDGRGRLDGHLVSTSITKHRVRRRDLDFRSKHTAPGFEEVSAYFHVCAGLSRLEELGYTGTRRFFRNALRINARGTRDDNSWYSPGERTLTFGLGDVDDAEDGETVLHEFGHAIQDAICPDFGQSPEAAAMGEGFGDYFAGSYFAEKKPDRYRLSVMCWDGAHYRDPDVERLAKTDPKAAAVLEEKRPPCVRRLDSALSYESFDRRPDTEHENGEIWSATLWEIREAVGREVADRMILDSHFQLDGFTTFARGARAILDADRNLNRGAHLAALRRILRRRGIGPIE